MRTWLWIPLVAAACADPDALSETDTDQPDTEVPCDTTRFTGTVDLGATNVTMPEGAVSLSLVPVAFGEAGGVGDPWFTAKVGAMAAGANAFSVCLPDLGEIPEELYAAPDDAYPESTMVAFAVVAWTDADGDEVFGPGDGLVGGTLRLLASMRSPATDLYPEAAEGWNLVTVEIDSQGPVDVHALGVDEAYAMPGNLLTHVPADLSGTLAGSSPEAVDIDVQLFGLPPDQMPPDPVFTGVDDFDASSPGTSFVIPGPWQAPAVDHIGPLFADGGLDNAVEGALYIAVAYLDLNGNGRSDPGVDTLVGTSLDAATPRILVFARPTGFGAIVIAELLGGLGWRVIVPQPDGQPPAWAPWSDGVELDLRG